MSILRDLDGPADLRGLTEDQLAQLAAEIRETIIGTVANTGGHLGSSLGVVELTLALHRLLESPRDRIVWDTGHQAYPHKLLTGRLDRFGTLRQIDGVGGFPRRSESIHDVFDGGHAGTGLSIAEGLAEARDIRHGLERIAVVVGDAALMSGLSLEALNDIGHRQTQLLIVLNDNEMSISPTVGAFSKYLSQIKLSRTWRESKSAYDRTVERIPVVGPTVLELSRRLRKSVVNFAQPGQLFEDLGITYIGVVPGHDIRALLGTLGRALTLPGPTIVHVRTQKGRGYRPAETDQIGFHGAALPPMTLSPGADAYNGARTDGKMPTESMADDAAPPAALPRAKPKAPNYTAVFVAELIELARTDRRIVGITAGMPTGTGLSKFQAEFPDRFFDVGIAEQHSMTFATGLALGGMRPVVALYSTFLQRAFDQTVHDVCQNDQPVLIAVDRAGLVGEDGTSHQGMFTLPAQLQLPHLVVASPKDEQELRSLLRTAIGQDHPFALHYPRDAGFGLAPIAAAGAAHRAGRGAARGARPAVRRLRADRVARGRGGRRARSRGLVDRRDQRPVRQAARPPADPRPGSRQAARGHVRGERRDRRVRQRGARAPRGGPPHRPGLPRPGGPHRRHPGRPVRRSRRGGGPAAVPAARRGGAHRAGARVTGDPPRRTGPLGGGRGLDRPGPAAHCPGCPAAVWCT